jgi:hypothetical protein
MADKKINDVKLLQFIRDGNSPAEAARKLGVGRAAVCKRLKLLKVGTTKDIALRSAPRLINTQIDALGQLVRINDGISSELDAIERELLTAESEAKGGLRGQKLKHTAEIRKQLGLFIDLLERVYSVRATEEFQREVVTILGEVSPEVRAEIIRRLTERRAIRSTLAMD